MDPEDRKRLIDQGIIKDRRKKSTHGNVCWYVGNTLMETIAGNKELHIAYAIRTKYRRYPQYKTGTVKVDLL